MKTLMNAVNTQQNDSFFTLFYNLTADLDIDNVDSAALIQLLKDNTGMDDVALLQAMKNNYKQLRAELRQCNRRIRQMQPRKVKISGGSTSCRVQKYNLAITNV